MATAHRLSSGRKLKLLFILDAFPDPHAGTEGQFWLLFNRLDRSRIEPAILLLRPSPFLSANVKDVPLKVLDVTSVKSPRALWRIAGAVRWAKREGFEVAHIFFNDSAVVFPIPLRLAGLRVIVSRRDLGFWYTSATMPLLRLNARFVNAAVANCNAVKRVAHDKEGIPAQRIHVIYNGIIRGESGGSASTRERFGLPRDARLIVIVANLRPLKRNADAVRALGALPGELSDVDLVFVGEDRDGDGGDSHRRELEELARSLRVERRIHFTGKLPDPMPIVAEATVCMLCSETEGLSNAVIEYMLAGKPVVCTDVGGNAELVADGHNGFVIRVGDVTAIAAALVRLLADADLARRMGQWSRERALSLFDPQRMLIEHMALYQRLQGAT
jgi:glycosyltransferase involved in cell wall biosynthesis